MDLISKQAVIEAIQALQTYKLWQGSDIILLDKARVLSELMTLPSAQPERSRGEWIYGEDVDVGCVDGYRCDQCGFFVPWDYKHKSIDFIKDYHFCPNCGVDMRGEQDG